MCPSKEQLCLKCKNETLPFQTLSDLQFTKINQKSTDKSEDKLSHLPSGIPSEALKTFFKEINQINQSLTDENDEDQFGIDCKYVDIESFNFKKNKKNLSLFHLNIASLSKHKDELDTILTLLNYDFDIIGLTETKIKKSVAPIFDVNKEGYKYFSTPTECEKGGTLLYITNKFTSKARNDLERIMYKTNYLESTFREVIQKNKKNLIVGCVYRHPSMQIEDFNEHVDELFDLLKDENKYICIMGDFNIDLIKLEEDSASNNFFDNMVSNMFIPHITIPTRITPTSKTLIDNIYSNIEDFKNGFSGNLTLSISDHLAQFLIIPFCNSKQIPKNHNLYKRDLTNFDRENFLLDLLDTDWDVTLSLERKDPNFSLDSLYQLVNNLTDKYMPQKK